MKNHTSFTKENTPNRGLFGDKHPKWNGAGISDKESMKAYQRERLRRERNTAVETLGGECVSCGFSDKRALQIDHINGGGSKERKTRAFKGSFHSHVIKSFLKGEEKYQLLCANCNWIKRHWNNEMGQN